MISEGMRLLWMLPVQWQSVYNHYLQKMPILHNITAISARIPDIAVNLETNFQKRETFVFIGIFYECFWFWEFNASR
jgi:hypothetical protein